MCKLKCSVVVGRIVLPSAKRELGFCKISAEHCLCVYLAVQVVGALR